MAGILSRRFQLEIDKVCALFVMIAAAAAAVSLLFNRFSNKDSTEFPFCGEMSLDDTPPSFSP